MTCEKYTPEFTKRADLKRNQLIKLIKSLHGLSGSDDYWKISSRKHLKQNLELKPCMFDAALFPETSENI